LNSQAGRLFYSCNNPHNLTGRYRVPEFARPGPITSEKDFHEEAERRTGTSLSSDEVSRYWIMETLSFFSEHPGAVPLLLYNKLKATVGSCEIATNHSFYTASMFSPLLIWWPAPFALCIALGLPGLILGIRRDRRVTVLLAPLFTVLVTILIFYSSSRFRMPAVPFLLIGAGILLNALYDWLKKGQMVKSLSTLFFVGVLGVCSISVSCPEPSGTDTFLLAKAYWRQGDLESAERFAREGAVRFPSQARFHLLLGMTAFSRNQPDRALKEYQTALSLDPRSVDACHNMGLVFLEVKRPEEAIFWFQRALAIEERPDTFFYLAKAYEGTKCFSLARKSYDKFLKSSN
ncbi:MAG: tetratricopeptide repeat protein, partial [Deltaproteobacteria bacterium]|nr:tetratricopeptide repeat protein [Deltaproteobacteria bacterium]